MQSASCWPPTTLFTKTTEDVRQAIHKLASWWGGVGWGLLAQLDSAEFTLKLLIQVHISCAQWQILLRVEKLRKLNNKRATSHYSYLCLCEWAETGSICFSEEQRRSVGNEGRKLYSFYYYRPQTKLRRLCFHRCLSVHRGAVCPIACRDTHTPSPPDQRQTPPE